jgi:redox-sensing transcriptional repressor
MVNKQSVHRLSLYRSALHRLKGLGFSRITSSQLSETLDVAATQIRKDFSVFGISGNRRGGYEIAPLAERLKQLLGKHQVFRVVVAGAGNIGTALAHYRGFTEEEVEITGVFDIDPAKIHRKNMVRVYHLDEMPAFIQKNKIKAGVICVPAAAAQGVCDSMVKAGIRGIINFAPVQLKVPDDCVIREINLLYALEYVAFYLQGQAVHKKTG